MKYAYSFDETGAYDCGYTSVQAAIEAARKEAEIDIEDGLKDVNIVYVGKVVTKKPEVDAWFIIESMQDYMDEETEGVSTDEGYLYSVSAEQLDKLECIMKDSIRRWSKEAENGNEQVGNIL